MGNGGQGLHQLLIFGCVDLREQDGEHHGHPRSSQTQEAHTQGILQNADHVSAVVLIGEEQAKPLESHKLTIRKFQTRLIIVQRIPPAPQWHITKDKNQYQKRDRHQEKTNSILPSSSADLVDLCFFH